MFFKAEDAIILTYCKDDNAEKRLKIKAEAGSYGSPMLELMCFNFPFAFFTQLFFIQPFVRTVFKFLFSKDIKKRECQAAAVKPESEAELDTTL